MENVFLALVKALSSMKKEMFDIKFCFFFSDRFDFRDCSVAPSMIYIIGLIPILNIKKDDVTVNTKVIIKSMTLVSLSRVALVSNMVQMVVYHAAE